MRVRDDAVGITDKFRFVESLIADLAEAFLVEVDRFPPLPHHVVFHLKVLIPGERVLYLPGSCEVHVCLHRVPEELPH